ncbi:MAG: methyl-accepting chemotaxis protein [Candidatus Geothermincolia bacterium]
MKTAFSALVIPITITLIYSMVIFRFGAEQFRGFGVAAGTVVVPLYVIVVIVLDSMQKRLAKRVLYWTGRNNDPADPVDQFTCRRLQRMLEALPLLTALVYLVATALAFGVSLAIYSRYAELTTLTALLYLGIGVLTGVGAGLACYFLIYDGYRQVRAEVIASCRGFRYIRGISLQARLIVFGVTVAGLCLGFGWIAALEQLRQQLGTEGLKGTAWLNISFLLLAIVLAGTIGFITYLISINVSRPVRALAKLSRRIANGDLAGRVNAETLDDLGELASAFDAMLESLQSITGEARESSEMVASGAESLSASTEQINAVNENLNQLVQHLSSNVVGEVKKIEEINDLMDGVLGTMRDSQNKAEQGAEISEEIERVVTEGRRQAAEAVREIGSIQELIATSAQAIRNLDERSSEVTMIVDVISNIAEQTNLLALNAAIEAARAREYGRGFAVVADEVKKLSEESNRSAQRIAILIRGIRMETESAVQAMAEGARRMAGGTEVVQRTDSSLGEIAERIGRMASISRDIAGESRREAEAAQDMARKLTDITTLVEANSSAYQELGELSQEQVAALQEVSATAQELAFLADRLDELVRHMMGGTDS